MEIRSLDGDDPATLAALLPGFRETMRLELPADPPVTEALLARLFQRRHGTERIVLAAYDAQTPAGVLKLGLDLGDPTGPGHGSLWVFPGFRRRGAGRALAAAGQAALRERGRDLLLADAPKGAAAERFAEQLGAELVGETLRNRLRLAGAAPGPLQAAAARQVPGYRLAHWTGRCPDTLVESYARAWSALEERVNGQARVRRPSTADVRAREAEAERAGHRIHAVAALPESGGDGGDIVAYSTLFVRDSPMADAGETLVLPQHRRRGLGTWMKADLLLRAARDNAGLVLVQVFNDVGNTAVVALNRGLGFEADSCWSTYALKA
ncbi:GNAT family N-acetyltransferase [Streptomyces yaanensis]|uniref:GNAT family N-acetyltransferase n=1 Tax=Streptomyces yaanensis TaxID=1142239 RepID=A0ABV7SIL7_9ACTN|nr:GNAT family N-acetyltransferase [Streptomyces sp. CGMCC 4.7035]WNC01004.1 GNAT family N-acetyltransferase [Streptomyces sp. CGMCC 4.7035]